MKRNIFLYLLLSCFASNVDGNASMQDDSCACTRQEAESVGIVRKQVEDKKAPLVAERMSELTDEALDLRLPEGISIPTMFFYKVLYASHIVEGNKTIGRHVELDNHSEWIVALDCKSDQTFLLEGAEDPVAEFNKLAQFLRLQANDTDAALDIFNFFLKVAWEQEFQSSVVDEMRLESLALADFRMRLPRAQGRAAFNKWWNSIPEGVKSNLSYPKVTTMKNGAFEVHYFSYHEGTVSRRSVIVDRYGSVALGESKVIVASK